MVETRTDSSSSVKKKTLAGRKLYIPQMAYEGAKLLAAAMRSVGIDAEISPFSDARTLELGAKYTSGDECYPEKITLGDFLKVTEQPDFDPSKVAFFMPSAGGPCRFGQYAGFADMVMRELGYEDILVLSPTSTNSYDEVGESAGELIRTAWWAVVAGDILRNLLHRTRPYETNKGDAEEAYETSIDETCAVLEIKGISHKKRFAELTEALKGIRKRFRGIPAKYDPEFPLIGLVGEIFCRHNAFSNENIIKVIEKFGAEGWLAGIAEWIWYTNHDQLAKLRKDGKRFSVAMAIAKLKNHFQRKDEHKLTSIFHDDFKGYEEAEDIKIILENSVPYLPYYGCLGEMVLSAGGSVYLYEKGVDGIADISPFTCMNGIASEAVFPHISRDHENIPIRTFYFDGTQSDLDRDVGIFIELARNYKRKKTRKRVYPFYFNTNN
jgi:predicted nucleotide-binding protein (sugar kinase/HSP70/actin superfamily)